MDSDSVPDAQYDLSVDYDLVVDYSKLVFTGFVLNNPGLTPDSESSSNFTEYQLYTLINRLSPFVARFRKGCYPTSHFENIGPVTRVLVGIKYLDELVHYPSDFPAEVRECLQHNPMHLIIFDLSKVKSKIAKYIDKLELGEYYDKVEDMFVSESGPESGGLRIYGVIQNDYNAVLPKLQKSIGSQLLRQYQKIKVPFNVYLDNVYDLKDQKSFGYIKLNIGLDRRVVYNVLNVLPRSVICDSFLLLPASTNVTELLRVNIARSLPLLTVGEKLHCCNTPDSAVYYTRLDQYRPIVEIFPINPTDDPLNPVGRLSDLQSLQIQKVPLVINGVYSIPFVQAVLQYVFGSKMDLQSIHNKMYPYKTVKVYKTQLALVHDILHTERDGFYFLTTNPLVFYYLESTLFSPANESESDTDKPELITYRDFVFYRVSDRRKDPFLEESVSDALAMMSKSYFTYEIDIIFDSYLLREICEVYGLEMLPKVYESKYCVIRSEDINQDQEWFENVVIQIKQGKLPRDLDSVEPGTTLAVPGKLQIVELQDGYYVDLLLNGVFHEVGDYEKTQDLETFTEYITLKWESGELLNEWAKYRLRQGLFTVYFHK